MNTNYPAPPWEPQAALQENSSPAYPRPPDAARSNRPAYQFSDPQQPLPAYSPHYSIPFSAPSGTSFATLASSSLSSVRLPAESFHIALSDSLDRIYSGSVDGEISLLTSHAGLSPARAVIQPCKISTNRESVALHEIHGLKLDYAGRVWVAHASGLFCFSPDLAVCLFYQQDNRPAKEKLDGYEESLSRLRMDYNRRTIYYLLAGGIVRTIDTADCSAPVPDYQFTNDASVNVVQWDVSPDGQTLFLLLDSERGQVLEVHSLPQRRVLPGFRFSLQEGLFHGETAYYSFAVDYNNGKLVVVGLSPCLDEEEQASGRSNVEQRGLVILTYQMEQASIRLIGSQLIPEIEPGVPPFMTNDAQFPPLESNLGVGAGTLMLSVLGGKRKLQNFLFLARWNPTTNQWYKHLAVPKLHKAQQLGWDIRGSLLVTAGEDATLSFLSFQ